MKFVDPQRDLALIAPESLPPNSKFLRISSRNDFEVGADVYGSAMIAPERFLAMSQRAFERFHKPFGYLMVNFNFLEHEMNHLFWRLSDINRFHDAQRCMLKARGFEQRVSLIEKVGQQKLHDQRGRSRLNRLVKRLRAVNEKRNDLIHGLWVSYGPPANIVRHVPPDQWRKLTATPASIRADAVKTLRVALSVRRFVGHLQKE